MKKTGIKILHLLSQRPDSTGSGIYLQAMLQEASTNGHQNYLLSGIESDRLTVVECLPEHHCSFVKFGNDIPYRIVGMSDVMPYESARFCDLNDSQLRAYHDAFTSKIKHAVDKFHPDIIHSHHLWLLSSLTKRLFPKIPMVSTCHGSDLRQFQNCPHLQETVLSGCKRIDAVMALSRAQKDQISCLYRIEADRIHVVGAGYNDKLFQGGLKPAPAPVQVVYAGKLSRAKGVPWLLRVLAKIDAPRWHLHLVGSGSGEESEECLMLARQLGENRVTIHGAVAQPELADIMRRSHIFVLPSFYEGLPLVLMEALASGCRIIANDLPGVVELLGHIRSDGIRLIKTPRLHAIDQPFPEDEIVFEQALERAIRLQCAAAVRQPVFTNLEIRTKLAEMSWNGVFAKVERIYAQTVGVKYEDTIHG